VKERCQITLPMPVRLPHPVQLLNMTQCSLCRHAQSPKVYGRHAIIALSLLVSALVLLFSLCLDERKKPTSIDQISSPRTATHRPRRIAVQLAQLTVANNNSLVEVMAKNQPYSLSHSDLLITTKVVQDWLLPFHPEITSDDIEDTIVFDPGRKVIFQHIKGNFYVLDPGKECSAPSPGKEFLKDRCFAIYSILADTA